MLAIASVTHRHLGGRVLATELRDYGAVGPRDFAGCARVELSRRFGVIGGFESAIDPALGRASVEW
jgi:hypothetical protein